MDIFPNWFVEKIVLWCLLKRPKIKEKEDGNGPFFLKKTLICLTKWDGWVAELYKSLQRSMLTPALKNYNLEFLKKLKPFLPRLVFCHKYIPGNRFQCIPSTHPEGWNSTLKSKNGQQKLLMTGVEPGSSVVSSISRSVNKQIPKRKIQKMGCLKTFF